MKALFRILNDGGPFFTYIILLLLLSIVILFVYTYLKKNQSSDKTIDLLKSLGWFVFVWGLLGSNIGLISAFDRVQAAGDIAPSVLAGGLKMALINPLMGFITFLIARIGIIILIATKKNKAVKE